MSDQVVDLADSPPTSRLPIQPSSLELKAAIQSLLSGCNPASLSLKELRRQLTAHFDLQPGSLDQRRDEIKTITQEVLQSGTGEAAKTEPSQDITHSVMQEAGNPQKDQATDAGAPLQAKKRKSLLAASAPEPSQAAQIVAPVPSTCNPSAVLVQNPKRVPAPAGQTEAPQAKKRRAAGPSAFMIFANESRARIAEELSASKGTKASFGEVAGAVSAAWKALAEDQRATYDKKAADAKAAAPIADETREPKVQSRGSGRANGGVKGSQPSKEKGAIASNRSMTRADFLKAATTPMLCTLGKLPEPDHTDGLEEQEKACGSDNVAKWTIPARLFKTGSAGWFYCGKVKIPIPGGAAVTAQAQVSLTVCGSKNWEDGEGLAALAAQGSVQASQDGEDGACPSASPESTECNIEGKEEIAQDDVQMQDDVVQDASRVGGA